MSGKILTRQATLTVNDAEDGLISSVGDTAVVDVSEMHSITVFVNHVVDGTDEEGDPAEDFSLVLEKTIDGINFSPLATLDVSDFGTGDNVAVEVELKDANGMSTRARQVRASLAAMDGTSGFSIFAVGVEG